jgi:hypothetical protein
VPDWVNELRAGKDLKRGLRVYLKAAARRRLRRDPSGGTVVNVWDDHGTPYIKLRLDGENSRQAISYHPSWLRPGVQYRVTFRMAG